MTNAEIKTVVANTILSCHNCTGVQFETACQGIHPDERGMVALAIGDLIHDGLVEMCEVRAFDGVGNSDTITKYRKVF